MCQFKYGMLTPIEKTELRYKKDIVWKFTCDCGEIVYRSLSAVKRNTKLGYVCSCGKHTTQNKNSSSKRNAEKLKLKVLKHGANIAMINKEKSYKNNKLGVKGVYFDKTKNKYVAQITFKGEHWLKRFDTLDDAKRAYLHKKEEIMLNFI